VSRRGVLATAGALAGVTGVAMSASSAAGSPSGRRTGRKRGMPVPPLVVEGGTLLDPATGEVVEDGSWCSGTGGSLPAGPVTRLLRHDARSRTGPRSSTPAACGSCPDSSTRTCTSTRWPMRPAYSGTAPPPHAAGPRCSTRTWRSALSRRGSRVRCRRCAPRVCSSRRSSATRSSPTPTWPRSPPFPTASGTRRTCAT
jgi:hypothetical protein